MQSPACTHNSHKRFKQRIGAFVLFLTAFTFGCAAQSGGEHQTTQSPSVGSSMSGSVANLTVVYEGGSVASNMALILRALTEEKPAIEKQQQWKFLPHTSANLLPSIRVVVRAQDKNICFLLEEHLKTPQSLCTTDLIEAVQSFNKSRGGESSFRENSVIYFPQISVEEFGFRRTYDLEKSTDRATLRDITRNSEWAKIITDSALIVFDSNGPTVKSVPATSSSPQAKSDSRTPNDRGLRTLTLRGFRWKIPISSPEYLQSVDDLAAQLSGANLTLIVERSTEPKVEPIKFLDTPSAYLAACQTNATPPERARFHNYLPPLYSIPDSAIQCQQSTVRPIVHVIDTPIRPHQDLVHALSSHSEEKSVIIGPNSDRCGPPPIQIRPDEHHGTFLASIIGARGRKIGIEGIFPEVSFGQVLWDGTVNESSLRAELQRINRNSSATTPQIFLFASTFKVRTPSELPTEEAKDKFFTRGPDNSWLNVLKDRNARVDFHSINRLIKNQGSSLFIISAGQLDHSAGAPDVLRRTSTMSPQNMGDLNNVIAVTACKNCDDRNGSVRIWERAFASARDEQVVVLAAPGGDDVAGFADENHLATSRGTSASAAFVAGIAARMSGCYATEFLNRPERIKRRLLITARPSLVEGELDKAIAGTLDVHLALTNPQKTWLKAVDQSALQEVSFERWCTGRIELRDDDGDELAHGSIELTGAIERLSRVGSGKLIAKEFAPDNDWGPVLRVKGPGYPGQPGRAGNPERDKRAALVKLQNGHLCALRVNQIEDLIMARSSSGPTGVSRNTCETAPICWQQK